MNYEKRTARLELRVAQRPPSLLDMLMLALTGELGEDFRGAADQFVESLGCACNRFVRLPNDRARGIATVLMHGTDRLFDIERFRGIVPDAVLAAVYSAMRNYVHPDPAVVLRVRRLAGVVDESGAPLDGYALADNGCIPDAPAVG